MSSIRGTAGNDIFNFSGRPIGIEYRTGGGNDIVVGTNYDDIFRVEGSWGADMRNTFFGGAGNDVFYGGEGAATFVGGAGADVFIGGYGVETISYQWSPSAVTVYLNLNLFGGGDANGDRVYTQDGVAVIDNITGSAFDDLLHGNDKDNTLSGLDGNDEIYGGGGINTLEGGKGNDFFGLTGYADRVDGGAGIDTVGYLFETGPVVVDLKTNANDGAADRDHLTGVENVIGTVYADRLFGDAGANVLDGRAGKDLLVGRGGADQLKGDGTAAAGYADSAGAVTVDLGSGRGYGGDAQGDTLSGIGKVVGSSFNDLLKGSVRGNEILEGGNGNDTLKSGGGADWLYGNGGDDTLENSDNGGWLFGGDGNDTFVKVGDNDFTDANGFFQFADTFFDGGAGFDRITYDLADEGVRVDLGAGTGELGARGDHYSHIEAVTGSRFGDYLTGASGTELLNGGIGDDHLVGGAGADTLIGGSGFDTASYYNSFQAVSVDLYAGTGSAGDASGDVLSGIEKLEGSLFNDLLRGSNRSETFAGGDGNDTIFADHFGSGVTQGSADVLIGGAGRDTMWGGGGADRFVFQALSDSGNTKASADVIIDFRPGDRIDLSGIDPRPDLGGNQAFTFIGNAPFSAPGQVRLWSDGTDTFVSVNAAGDNAADMHVALSGHVALSAGDFIL